MLHKERLEPVNGRCSAGTGARLDRIADSMSAAVGSPLKRSDAIRAAMEAGVAALEAKYNIKPTPTEDSGAAPKAKRRR
jgi:hypothetical protein